VIRSAVAGTPQGGVISPLLANAYLPLDVAWEKQGRAKLIRYCDDYVILCRRTRSRGFSARRSSRPGVEPERGRRASSRPRTGSTLGMHFRLRPMRSNPGAVLLSVAGHERCTSVPEGPGRGQYDDIASLDKIRALNPILRG
jgi:RNA-directed DNA polymerase